MITLPCNHCKKPTVTIAIDDLHPKVIICNRCAKPKKRCPRRAPKVYLYDITGNTFHPNQSWNKAGNLRPYPSIRQALEVLSKEDKAIICVNKYYYTYNNGFDIFRKYYIYINGFYKGLAYDTLATAITEAAKKVV